MKKYVLWPLLAAIGGVGAFLLRLLQRSTGFEVDTGLPIPGNLYAILLVAWFVVLAAVCLLAARPLLPADREDPPLFPTGFSVASPGLLTPAVMGLFLLAASGVLDLLFGFSGASALTGSGETVTVFVTAQGSQLFSGREHLVVGLLSLLSAASLLPAVPACRIRPEGGARKPFQSPLLLVPVCCLVVRLVLTYRVVSVDPTTGHRRPSQITTRSCWRWCSWLWPSTGCPPSPSGRGGPAASPSMRRWPSPSAWPLWRIGRIRPGCCSTWAAP